MVCRPYSRISKGLFRVAAHRGSDDVVDDLRLLNPAQVSGAVERDDGRLGQSAREMSSVFVGHHAVGVPWKSRPAG